MSIAVDHRKPLSFLVAASRLRRDGQVKITVPFSADIEPGGMPVRITEVREQSASWTSLLDERKTGSINLANVLVDPAEIEWRQPNASRFATSPEDVRPEPAQPKEATPMTEALRHCNVCGKDKPVSGMLKSGIKRCLECNREYQKGFGRKTRATASVKPLKAKAIPAETVSGVRFTTAFDVGDAVPPDLPKILSLLKKRDSLRAELDKVITELRELVSA